MRLYILPTTVDCPHCREKNLVSLTNCHACGKPLTVYIGPADVLPRRLGLSSIMLAVAVLAPCLVVLREVPPLGALLLLIAVPAMVRTSCAISTRISDGRPMISSEKVATFLASVGIVWLMGIAASLAFGAVFMIAGAAVEFLSVILPTGSAHLTDSPWGVIVIAPVATLAGLAVIRFLGRRLWAIRN